MPMSNSPLILAVDTSQIDVAREWIGATREYVGVYKLGLEFFLKNGPQGIEELRKELDFPLFLDLKLHDIANTVAGAARSLSRIAPDFLTVHASGGQEMVSAAVKELPETSITGVTILTSLSAENLSDIGFALPPLASAVKLALLATGAGARAIVCSPQEVGEIRSAVDPGVNLITPGVRPEGSELGDQVRVLTPKAAMTAGANYFVIGRPITSLWDPSEIIKSRSAMAQRPREILESL